MTAEAQERRRSIPVEPISDESLVASVSRNWRQRTELSKSEQLRYARIRGIGYLTEMDMHAILDPSTTVSAKTLPQLAAEITTGLQPNKTVQAPNKAGVSRLSLSRKIILNLLDGYGDSTPKVIKDFVEDSGKTPTELSNELRRQLALVEQERKLRIIRSRKRKEDLPLSPRESKLVNLLLESDASANDYRVRTLNMAAEIIYGKNLEHLSKAERTRLIRQRAGSLKGSRDIAIIKILNADNNEASGPTKELLDWASSKNINKELLVDILLRRISFKQVIALGVLRSTFQKHEARDRRHLPPLSRAPKEIPVVIVDLTSQIAEYRKRVEAQRRTPQRRHARVT